MRTGNNGSFGKRAFRTPHHNPQKHYVVLLNCDLGFAIFECKKKELVKMLTKAASADSDHSSAATDDGLTDARGKSDSCFLAILGVTDDDGGGAGGAGEGAAVAELGLTVGDDGAFGHHINWEDVTDGEGGY